jgi:hypothetical protein
MMCSNHRGISYINGLKRNRGKSKEETWDSVNSWVQAVSTAHCRSFLPLFSYCPLLTVFGNEVDVSSESGQQQFHFPVL